ncbi:hypothetical protein BT93_E0225 [Corymbia citriodora subsp. variegata]|nr:hypothetical protein BT93_E0225 [Corymbia citriodora subsp. variegata]
MDDCEPCPSHGECHKGKLDCARGYRKLGRSCVEDGDINETARKLSEWVENHLCESNAQLLCYGMGTAWVPAEEIWNDLDGHPLMKNFGWDTAIFIYTKQKAIEATGKIMQNRTEVSGMKELKCPDSVAEHFKPYTCRIRLWIFKHVLLVVPVSLLLVASAMLIWKVRCRWHLSTRVEELYHQVEELVQEDSRIDRYPKLVKGESKVVWEWQVEGSLSSSRSMKKGEQGKLKSSHGRHLNFDQPSPESRRDLQASLQ